MINVVLNFVQLSACTIIFFAFYSVFEVLRIPTASLSKVDILYVD